ncbi:PREDICTED: Fanconi anemia group C protein-like [Branchiostoma belcheri]|uniref:Fanconi anemia group C protein-like n=1 Tax=Branchiostoma belcheri TaxID=7741 RepID=A0A6P5AHK6_BRABE|nr:PREDICTED: Fanconi anemia group C protein-like [Branchiostoma belcheri]
MDSAELDLWLDRAKSWGEPGGVVSTEGLRTTCRCLGELETFLRGLHVAMTTWDRPAAIMRHLPNIGQFLGRLCHNPAVLACGDTCSILQSCLTVLCTDSPQEDIERRAANWAQKMLRHVITGPSGNGVSKTMGYLPSDQNKLALEKLLHALSEDLDQLQQDRGIKARPAQPCTLHQLSELCLPLVSMPTASLLVEKLLLAGLEGKTRGEELSVLFLQSVVSAQQQLYSNKLVTDDVSLSPHALCALWTLNSPSLEQDVLDMVETVTLHRPYISTEDMKTLIHSRGLPTACVLQPTVNNVTRQILRHVLEHSAGSPSVLNLLRVFNECFILELCKLQGQAPTSVLHLTYNMQQLPLVHLLILHPAGLSKATCQEHLKNICRTIQTVQSPGCQLTWTQVTQAGVCPKAPGISCGPESWYVLVQFGWWYSEACRLLLLSPVPPHSCLQYLACCHLPQSPEQQQAFMTCIQDVASTLHGLLPKIHPKSHDLLYAVSANQQLDSPARRAVIGQLLMLFLLHSVGGYGIADDILDMAVGDQDAERRLAVLLDTIEENLVGKKTGENPSWVCKNKITAMLQVINGLQLSLQELHALKEPNRPKEDDLNCRCEKVKQLMQNFP